MQSYQAYITKLLQNCYKSNISLSVSILYIYGLCFYKKNKFKTHYLKFVSF